MTQLDTQGARIEEIIGDDEEATFDDCFDKFFDHLKSSLQLPCDVTGIEDFRWEEVYVIGPGDRKEHERLRKNQPSCEDTFELLAIGGVRVWYRHLCFILSLDFPQSA